MRWCGASLLETAKAVGVDRGNLSRFVRQAAGSGLSSGKAASLLEHLGWGPRGPLPSVVHRWLLDDREDVRWIFQTVLAGSTTVQAVFTDAASADILSHEGVLVGQWQGAWMVLGEKVLRSGSTFTGGEDLLGDLLNVREALATPAGAHIVADPVAVARLLEGHVSPAGLVKALGEQPVVDIGQEAREIVHEHSKLWLSSGRLRAVLDDGLTRLARHEPQDLVAPMLDDLLEYFRDRNQAAPGPNAIDACRRLAEERVAELAARSYRLNWSKPSTAQKPRSPSGRGKPVDRKRST